MYVNPSHLNGNEYASGKYVLICSTPMGIGNGETKPIFEVVGLFDSQEEAFDWGANHNKPDNKYPCTHDVADYIPLEKAE